MSTQPKSYSRPSCTVVTVPDPDNMPVSMHVQKGGTLQWRTDTHNYPNFEIRFKGSNPFNEEQDLVLQGSDDEPVIMRLNTVKDDYFYIVRHFRKDGTCVDTGTFMFNVHPCPGCPP
jgi:hypothetical protein